MFSKKKLIKNLESLGIPLIQDNVDVTHGDFVYKGILFKFPFDECIIYYYDNSKSWLFRYPKYKRMPHAPVHFPAFFNKGKTKSVVVADKKIHISVYVHDILRAHLKITIDIRNTNYSIMSSLKQKISPQLKIMAFSFLHDEVDKEIFLDAIKDELATKDIFIY